MPSLLQALKALFTSRSTGIGRKGRWLAAEDLEAYLYAMSQPGALTGALNYYRNVFRWALVSVRNCCLVLVLLQHPLLKAVIITSLQLLVLLLHFLWVFKRDLQH